MAEDEVLNSMSHPGENIVNAYFIKITTITWAPLTVQTMFHLESWHSGEYNVNAALLNLFKNYLGFLKNCVVFTKIYVRARER